MASSRAHISYLVSTRMCRFETKLDLWSLIERMRRNARYQESDRLGMITPRTPSLPYRNECCIWADRKLLISRLRPQSLMLAVHESLKHRQDHPCRVRGALGRVDSLIGRAVRRLEERDELGIESNQAVRDVPYMSPVLPSSQSRRADD